MKRATSLFATVALLALSPLMVGQELQSPIPPTPSNILGPQLIVWSQQQMPLPVPQPLPDPPEQQQEKRPALSQNSESQQQPAVRTFTGRITTDGSKFVLIVSKDSVYQLDDQQKAKQYDGQEVKLVGTLDEAGASVRVISIELIS